MSSEQPPKPPRSLVLERFLAGTASAGEEALVRDWAAADPSLASWLAARREEAERFASDPRRPSFSTLVAEAGGETRAFKRRRWGRGIALIAVVSSMAAAFALVTLRDPPSLHGPRVTARGGLTARVLLRRGDSVTNLEPGSRLLQGDRLQLIIEDANGGFATVLLQEDTGSTQVLYHPSDLGRLPAGTFRFPDSLHLDGHTGDERLYIVLAETLIDPSAWVGELQAAFEEHGFAHAWQPPAGCRSTIVSLHKVGEP